MKILAWEIYQADLLPEKIYLNKLGEIQEEEMIWEVRKIFKINKQSDRRTMNVETFIEYTLSSKGG